MKKTKFIATRDFYTWSKACLARKGDIVEKHNNKGVYRNVTRQMEHLLMNKPLTPEQHYLYLSHEVNKKFFKRYEG